MRQNDTTIRRKQPSPRSLRRGVLALLAGALGSLLTAQPCTPVNVPYAENFDAATPPALPDCIGSDAVSGSPWTTAEAPDGYTGNIAEVHWTSASSPDMDTWLFTRGLNLTGGASYRLSYKYGNNSTSYTERMSVSLGNAATAADMTSQLADHAQINDDTPHTNTIDFTPGSTGVYYIGFKCYSIADQYYLYLDDIKVTVTPTCEAPGALTLDDFTLTDATFSWAASISAPANGYQWEVRDANAPGSGAAGLVQAGSTGTGVHTASVNSLNPNTGYFAYVRASCINDDFSEWTGPLAFTTPCDAQNVPYLENFESAAVPALPNCISEQTVLGPQWETVDAGPAGMTGKMAQCVGFEPTDSWLYTAGLNLAAGTSYRLTYKYSNQYDFYVDAMQVAYGTERLNTAMGNVLMDHPVIDDGLVHTDTVEFTPAADGVYYIGFRKYTDANSDNGFLFLDDIKVVVTPTCEEPTALTAGTLTTNTADFSWAASTSIPADGYQWELRDSGNPGSGATGLVDAGTAPAGTLSASAAGLQSNTTYHLYVRSLCSDADMSTWAGPLTFTSRCDATDVPYTEDFNSVTPPAIPNCMSLETISGSAWETTEGPAGYSVNVAYIHWTPGGSPDMDSWIFTQALNLHAAATYRLSYKYGNNSSNYTERMSVAYGGPGATAADMTQPLADHGAITGGDPQTNTVNFTPPADGVYHIGFKCYSIADQYLLYLDDIMVEELTNGIAAPALMQGIAVYPNPASTELQITTPNGRPVHVKAYDMVGKLALEKDMVTRIDVANLAPGSYTLQITDEKGNVQGRTRFVKQ